MFGESRIQASGSFYEILSVCRRRVCMIKKYVVKDFERPRQDILKKYQNLDVSTVYEAQGKKGLMNNGLKPNLQEKNICGPAVIATSYAGSNLMVQTGIEDCKTGDILLIKGIVESDD